MEDIIRDYNDATTTKKRAECIERMVKYISEHGNIEVNFLEFFEIIHQEDYSKLVGYFKEIPNSNIIVEKYLDKLIHDVSIYNFAELIIVLKTYYSEIKLSHYQDLLEEKMRWLCKRVDNYYQYDEIKKIWNTGIFLYSWEHYLVEDLIAKQLTGNYQVSFYGEQEIYKEKIYQFLHELEKKEQVNQVEYLDFGSTSIVFKVGNSVIKFGGERMSDSIIEHPRILSPLYYEYFEDALMVIEVQPFVDTSAIPPLIEYEIMIELYESGIAWLDPDIRNIGRVEDGTHVVCDNDYLYYLEKLDIDQQEQAFRFYQNAKEKCKKLPEKTFKKRFIHKKS